MSLQFYIKGIQESQAANNAEIAALQPAGPLGAAIREAVVYLHRYAVAITHVDYGALKAAHRMQVTGLAGRIYVDPAAVNVKTGKRPAVYGPYEHARGGSHAFYDRTVREAGPEAARRLAMYARRP